MARSQGSARVTVRNRCDYARTGSHYLPIVEDAIAAYREVFADQILDIRLQGSVARGDAVVGQSDIDFMALLHQVPDDHDVEQLQDRAGQVGRRYPIVSRVEFDVVAIDSLSRFQRFVLSSDSLSVYGRDRLTRKSQRIDRLTLARLVTPGAPAMVADYRALIQELEADPEALRFFSRIVAKDLLKCVRSVVLQRGGPYEVRAAQIRHLVTIHVPELARFADDLTEIYLRPLDEHADVLPLLDEAGTALLPIINADHETETVVT